MDPCNVCGCCGFVEYTADSQTTNNVLIADYTQLDQEQSHPAGPGVDQHLVARVQSGDAEDQEMGGHALEQRR